MSAVEQLVMNRLGLWTSTIKRKSAAGRGPSKKIELYGIRKLRELILELAVRGLLVPQDPSDEPASELLKKVAAEKARLVKEGSIKKGRTLTPISNEEKPFELPEGWEWSRLGKIGNIFNGNSVNASVKESKYRDIEGLSFIATKDVGYGFETLDYQNGIYIPVGEPNFRIAKKNTILICAEGGSAGKKCGITDRDICFGNKLFANEPFGDVNPKFILSTYLTPTFFNQFSSSMSGIIGGISSAKFSELVVPVAPASEQHRIVAKVDEMMELCDQLEQKTDASIGGHQILVETLLSALANATSNEQFTTTWQCISSHFDTLFTTEHSIDQLKQSVLQVAVMGKLVSQDPNDEPARELLKKIVAEKTKLVKEGKAKKEKPLPPIDDKEIPFELPAQWAFSHLQDVCSLITDGTHQTPTYTEAGRPFISAQCVKPFKFLPENCRYVSEAHYLEYIKNRIPEYGDILLSRVGSGIGEAAVIDTELEFAIYVSTGLLKPVRPYFLSKYLAIWLNSPIGRHYSASRTLGKGVSQGNLNLSLIRTFIVSVPPLNEQKRIVTKVEELMELCDQLKARLNDAQTILLHLTDAVVEKTVER